eukprot:6595959-Alexandrium_andersonii.AAC.1
MGEVICDAAREQASDTQRWLQRKGGLDFSARGVETCPESVCAREQFVVQDLDFDLHLHKLEDE